VRKPTSSENGKRSQQQGRMTAKPEGGKLDKWACRNLDGDPIRKWNFARIAAIAIAKLHAKQFVIQHRASFCAPRRTSAAQRISFSKHFSY